jgi:stage V sporulation protein G
MNITQVKVFPVHEDKLKAFVSIVFDHCFMVNDIKVIQGKDGLFLSMPSRRKRTGEFKDVAHPLNNETRRLLEERVLTEYRLVVDDPTPRRPDREGEDLAEEDKSVAEVQELHLQDSFWSVT